MNDVYDYVYEGLRYVESLTKNIQLGAACNPFIVHYHVTLHIVTLHCELWSLVR